MVKNRSFLKWLKRILLGIVIFLIVISVTAYLLQHYYGEKWVKQYVQKTIAEQTDGLYSVEMKDLSLNLLLGRITITGLKLIPDTVVYYRLKSKGHVPPFLVSVNVPGFSIRGFFPVRALLRKNIFISSISIENPSVELIRMSLPDTIITDTVRVQQSLSIPIPPGLNSVVVNFFRLTKGKFTYTDKVRVPYRSVIFPKLEVEVQKFRQDKNNPYSRKIFNSEDIIMTMEGFAMNMPDSLYHLSLGSIGISTKSKAVLLDSLILKPRYPRAEFFRRIGYQTDRFEVEVGHIGIENIDFPAFLLNNIFHTGYVMAENWKIKVYRDKRIPRKPGYHPDMPQQAIRKIKAIFTIDSLRVSKGYAIYYEQTGDEPGHVFFSGINATVRNISTDSLIWMKKDLVIRGSAMLMGKGYLHIVCTMPVYAPNQRFTYTGYISVMDLTEINPMLTKLFPAKIVRGTLDKIIIPPVYANNDRSKGTLLFYYHDLNLSFSKENLNKWQSLKTDIMNIAANAIIANENPGKNQKLRPGIIQFERDKGKGILNFLWKSTFSGIKSSMGLNSKEQRATKKEMRQAKREQKKKRK